jgi:acyl dehydratase
MDDPMLKPRAERLYLEDLHVGQRWTSAPHKIDAEQIKRFAAEYDPQPFHLSDEGAAGTMFGSLAASGWHTMALTMRMLVESVPLADGLIGASTEVAWPRPTRPGMILQAFSEIVDIKPSRSKPDMAIVTQRSETRDQDGNVVLIFTARMPVYKRNRS